MRLALTLAAGLAALAGSAFALTAASAQEVTAAPPVAAAAAPAAPATCDRPTPPAVVDGSTATIDQIKGSQRAAAMFVDTSDAYQSCVVDNVKAQRDAAKANRTHFDDKIAKAADAQLDANQKDKEAVVKAFNAAVKAFKAAHPA